MKPEEVLKYFKSPHYFGKETDMSGRSLWNWLEWGFIPYKSQKKIEEHTKGKLIAVWEDSQCPKKSKS
jgi:hypothetical protein